MTPLLQLPELANYLDEPAQLPSGSPGKIAEIRMEFKAQTDRSILSYLYRRAPLIVHRAIYWDEEMPGLPCIFMISNAGAILQGDRNTVSIEMHPGSQAHVTSQSATKVHEMDANFASQVQDIVMHENSYLEYLPDPLIPHKHARFVTQTRIQMDPSATLLYSETLMGGRKHHGELFQFDLFSSTVRAERPDSTEMFTEKLIVTPHQFNVRQAGIMDRFDVLGTVILLTPIENANRVFERCPAVVNLEEGWAAACSRLPDNCGLIYKVLSSESAVVRKMIREFWAISRDVIVGKNIMSEFRWR